MTKDELTNQRTDKSTATAFKLITPFNRTIHWPKLQKTLNTIHEAIIRHYSNEPFKDLRLVQMLEKKPIRIVFSSEPALSSYFSGPLKHTSPLLHFQD